MNTTLCMKLFLFLSFLALSDAWGWSRGFLPVKPGTLARRGPEQDSPVGPLKAIVGEIDELHQDIAALTARVDELENNFEELVSAIQGQEDGFENAEPIADPSALEQRNQVSAVSDETAVRVLLQHYPEEHEQK